MINLNECIPGHHNFELFFVLGFGHVGQIDMDRQTAALDLGADPVNATGPLFQNAWIPAHVVMDHDRICSDESRLALHGPGGRAIESGTCQVFSQQSAERPAGPCRKTHVIMHFLCKDLSRHRISDSQQLRYNTQHCGSDPRRMDRQPE